MEFYPQLKWLHVGAVTASGLLFAATASGAASTDYYLKIDSVGLDQGGPVYLKA